VLNEDKVAAKNAGMDGFATKPVNFQELCTEIARVTGIAHKTVKKHAQAQGFHSDVINEELAISLWQTTEVYLKELSLFLNQNTSLVDELRALFDEEDSLAFLAKVHAMKGVSANLALDKLEEQFVMLESACKGQQSESCEAILDNIEYQLSLVLQESERLNNSAESVAPDIEPTLDTEEGLEVINTLINVANASEFDEDALSKLRLMITAETENIVMKIEAAFEDFDFDEAEALLKEMKLGLMQG
jgi:hypothetical protein